MPTSKTAPAGRLGDAQAAARLIARLDIPSRLGIGQKRQLLAQFCRLIESQIRLARGSDGSPPAVPKILVGPDADGTRAIESPPGERVVKLSPRMRQTLDRLLAGDSEKQVARRLGVSPHTVHVYIKAIYRKHDVSSRAELLSKFVRRSSGRD